MKLNRSRSDSLNPVSIASKISFSVIGETCAGRCGSRFCDGIYRDYLVDFAEQARRSPRLFREPS